MLSETRTYCLAKNPKFESIAVKSALPALTSARQLTTLVAGSLHSIIGYTPVVIPPARTTSHFSFSSKDVVHQIELVEHNDIATGTSLSVEKIKSVKCYHAWVVFFPVELTWSKIISGRLNCRVINKETVSLNDVLDCSFPNSIC